VCPSAPLIITDVTGIENVDEDDLVDRVKSFWEVELHDDCESTPFVAELGGFHGKFVGDVAPLHYNVGL